MSASLKLFIIGLRQIIKDGMLFLLIFAPFLMGAVLRLILPLVNRILTSELAFSITPWYPLVNGFVLIETALMAAMISAFLILDERDEGIGIYYRVTPPGGHSYLIARIFIPMLWGFVSSTAVIILFGLGGRNIWLILLSAIVGTLQGAVACMVLVALAGNKVEGLALSKLMNFFLLGLPASWFIHAPYKYLLGFMPSFWIGEILQAANRPVGSIFIYSIIGTFVSILWIRCLYQSFVRNVF